MALKFTDGIISTLSFAAAGCAALTATGGTLAVAGGLLTMGASGMSLSNCVADKNSADFTKHMKAAQKFMADQLSLDARFTDDFTQEDIDRTFSELKHALPKFKADLLLADFARWNLDPVRVSQGLSDKLAQQDVSPYFASSEAGQYLSEKLIHLAFQAVKQEEAFWKNIDIYVQGEILARLDDVKSHMTSEADRIIAELTQKLNLAGREKLSFESAARHILESTDKRDAPTQEALRRGDLQTALSVRLGRLRQEDEMFDQLRRARAQEWRDTGAMAAPINVLEAINAYQSAIDYDDRQVWDYISLSRLWVAAGNLGEALKTLERARVLAGLQLRDQSVIHNGLGDIYRAQGDLGKALGSYQAGLAIAEKLAAQDPGNSGWQRDMSVSHNKLGDIYQAQGDLGKALGSYQAGLEIREKLVAQDPGNSGWQRDMIVSYVKLSVMDAERQVSYLENGLSIATTLFDQNKLAPTDHWLIEDLQSRLEKARKR